MLDEIVVAETKPATEWVLGRAVQKVSPKRRHALLQFAFAQHLSGWARGRGEVGMEWRFRVAPPGEVRRPLVPDVAYLSYARIRDLSDDELEAPLLAPDDAVEILSIGDRDDEIAHKVAVFLASGSRLVVVVDPYARVVDAHDPEGTTSFRSDDVFTHSVLEGLTLPLNELFDVLRRPR